VAVVKTILTVVFIIISVALTVIILMQESKSAGLGAIAGAEQRTFHGRYVSKTDQNFCYLVYRDCSGIKYEYFLR